MESNAKMWIIIAIIVGLILAIFLGIYTYNRGGISEMNVINTQMLAETQGKEYEENAISNDAIVTSNINQKISPNAIVVQKRYYKPCDHLIRETIDIPEELVNKTEEEVEPYYLGWQLESYSTNEIVIYKEFNEICNEHYVIKQNGNVLGVYIENEQGVLEWQEDTEIDVQYLPEDDIEEFKVGVKVVGKTNLYSFLEDYE